MDVVEIGDGTLRAGVLAHGAELCSLGTATSGELVWQAGDAWTRHAPVLFPIVGRLAGDTLHHRGRAYGMTQHGFARDRDFRLVDRSAHACRFLLADDDQTRACYPFRFELVVTHTVAAATLTTTYAIMNAGPDRLPVSLGTHTAFRWPLRDGVPKQAHRLVFALDETGPVRRLEGGLLSPDPVRSPIEGRVLPLAPSLFAHDAIILEHPASRSVRFEADGCDLAIEVAWTGFETLGIWSKPADFLCIEPWSGFASPVGFDGEFADKPGIIGLEPGATLERTLTIRAV